MAIYKNAEDIRKILTKLKKNSVPGKSNDGAIVAIRYESFGEATPEKVVQAKAAKMQNLDPRIYIGVLDKVWETSGLNPHLCVTMLTLTRIDWKNQKYMYRTFNLNKGRVRWVKTLD
jgi:hypothetical protein